MAKKSKFEEAEKDLRDEVQAFSKPKETVSQATTQKSMIEARLLQRLGDVWLVESIDQVGEFFHIPTDSVKTFRANDHVTIDRRDQTVIPLYNFKKEIEAMLPNRQTMIRNVQIAFLRTGVVSLEDARLSGEFARNATKGAFPYTPDLDSQ